MLPDSGSLSIPSEQILRLAGRLDDAPGFDTPRERFRRFLTEHITSLSAARTLIEEWQHSNGEQPHRALQDALVLLGRFLGFDTTFGAYQPSPGSPREDGQWRSRHRLHVLLEIRTHYSPATGIDSLLRSLTAMPQIDSEPRRIGMCVVTPLNRGRATLETSTDGDRPAGEIRIVSTSTLLTLAAMVETEAMAHDDLVKLLISSSNLDFIVELLEQQQVRQPDPALEETDESAGCWLAMIAGDGPGPSDQIVQLLISKRHVLGVSSAPGVHVLPRHDDWLGFFIPGRGIAGRARVASIAEDDGSDGGRDDRLNRVIRLRSVEIYEAPSPMPIERERRLTALFGDDVTGPVIAPVSREEFAELTAVRGGVSAAGTSRSRGSVHPIGQRPTRGARQAADGGI